MATPTVILNPVTRSVWRTNKKKQGVPCNQQLFSRAELPLRGAGAGRGPLQCKLSPGRLALTGASSVVATGGSLALTQKTQHTTTTYIARIFVIGEVVNLTSGSEKSKLMIKINMYIYIYIYIFNIMKLRKQVRIDH
jgi:hypothetical protein